MIRDAVLHLTNEQPLLGDLFERPGPGDNVLVCTNLRTLSGTRPIWIDDTASVFYFPFTVIRFVEIHPGSDGAPELAARWATGEELEIPEPPTAEPEGELEIDEELLRRVRDV